MVSHNQMMGINIDTKEHISSENKHHWIPAPAMGFDQPGLAPR